MKEFIVWHTLRKEFVQPYRNIVFDDSGIAENDLCTIHNYISLKDINNNKIYADCSIVEFQWVNGFGNIQTDWGVFKYDLDYLQYLIYEENEDINKSSIKEVFNIKIIDTIQENKLGLMD